METGLLGGFKSQALFSFLPNRSPCGVILLVLLGQILMRHLLSLCSLSLQCHRREGGGDGMVVRENALSVESCPFACTCPCTGHDGSDL